MGTPGAHGARPVGLRLYRAKRAVSFNIKLVLMVGLRPPTAQFGARYVL